jgi:hypothetical protein
LVPVRYPLNCAGSDIQELGFGDDGDFDATDDLEIGSELGSIVMRLDIVCRGKVHVAVTKTMV